MDGGARSIKHRIHAILVAPMRILYNPTLEQWRDIRHCHKAGDDVWVHHELGWFLVLDAKVRGKKGCVFAVSEDLYSKTFSVYNRPWTLNNPWGQQLHVNTTLTNQIPPTTHEDVAWEDMQANSK